MTQASGVPIRPNGTESHRIYVPVWYQYCPVKPDTGLILGYAPRTWASGSGGSCWHPLRPAVRQAM